MRMQCFNFFHEYELFLFLQRATFQFYGKGPQRTGNKKYANERMRTRGLQEDSFVRNFRDSLVPEDFPVGLKRSCGAFCLKIRTWRIQQEAKRLKAQRLNLRGDSPRGQVTMYEIQVFQVTHSRGYLGCHVDQAVEAVNKLLETCYISFNSCFSVIEFWEEQSNRGIGRSSLTKRFSYLNVLTPIGIECASSAVIWVLRNWQRSPCSRYSITTQ